MKAKRGTQARPGGAAARERRADRPRAPGRAALVRPGGADRRRRGRPARHADRGEAAAIRARDDRVLLRRAGRDGAAPGARPPGGARRAPRLRRDGAADRRARRAPARRGRGGAFAAARAMPTTSTRGSAPRRRIAPRYRGLEMLPVHVAARRALLFDRFVELWERAASASGGLGSKLEAAVEPDAARLESTRWQPNAARASAPRIAPESRRLPSRRARSRWQRALDGRCARSPRVRRGVGDPFFPQAGNGGYDVSRLRPRPALPAADSESSPPWRRSRRPRPRT